MPTAMEISSLGMSLEKLRLDIASKNISMMSHAAPVGKAIAPLSMVVNTSSSFESFIPKSGIIDLEHGGLVDFVSGGTKVEYEPKNPIANEAGLVEYPDTSHLNEMLNVLKATRAYEANIKAFNAAKVMNEEALDIGN